MGAHESNKGLCPALYRAFKTMGCEKIGIERRKADAASVGTASQDAASKMCYDLLEGIEKRNCTENAGSEPERRN